LKLSIFIYFFLLYSFGFNNFVKAQDAQEEMQKQIEEVLKARNQMLRSLLDDSDFGDMNKRMDKMLQQFDSDDFFQGGLVEDVVGEYDWKETDTQQILSLKVKQIKDRPLDIKIKNGKISLKGDVESQTAKENHKKITRVHFEREFSIPPGVDETRPEFENKKGELLIKFKKKKIAKQPIAPRKDLISVAPSPKDQTI
jgi:HSP20 family molecular chaperone IbpA